MPNTFKNDKAIDVGTSWATLYTCPAATTAVVIGLGLSNKLGTGITANMRLEDNDDASAVVDLIGTDTPIEVGATLVPYGGDQKLVLEANDIIEVISSDASSIDAVITVLEIS